MSWGYKILIMYLGFVAFIVTMVFMCLQYDVNLVAKDYYKQEIEYQQQIDKLKNTQSLSERLGVQFFPESKEAVFTFPASKHEDIKGEIHFFRPSDAGMDVKVPVKITKDGQQTVDVKDLKKGLWKVKVSWQSADKDYYEEQTLVL